MIHPTAVVSSEVELGEDVAVGPYTVIDGRVEIGDGCQIGPHCHISGATTIGANTRVHAGAVIGDEPQDHSYAGAISYTRIGHDCRIREYVTIHRGAVPESTTVIGDRVMVMGFAHVAHNCQLADDVVLVNQVLLAGHVHVGRRAFISGRAMVHQFVEIGDCAFVTGNAKLQQDVPPYCMLGHDGDVCGPNAVGLRRAGIDAATRQALKDAIKLFYSTDMPRSQAIEEIARRSPGIAEVQHFLDFVRASRRGIVGGLKGRAATVS